QYPEKPSPALLKILLERSIFVNAVGKQKSGQHRKDAGVADKKEIYRKRPWMEPGESNFKPPEMNDEQEGEQNPPHMNRIYPFLARMLHEAHHAIYQPRKA